MKNIFKTSLLLMLGVLLLTACKDDNGSNPTFQEPTQFVLNTPVVANSLLDLNNSTGLELTFSQPDYGYPAYTQYKVLISPNADMADAIELKQVYTTTAISIDPVTIAGQLTEYFVEKQGKTEADFPMILPLYVQMKAMLTKSDGSAVEGGEILSNIVKLNQVRLGYLLPPVLAPEHLYIIGGFCDNKWDNALSMVAVHSNPDLLWHMVYIDENGIKFNNTQAETDDVVGYDDITIDETSELGSEIVNKDGWIASNNPGWYMMIVQSSVVNREIIYNVKFNKPNVWLMGTVTSDDSNEQWSEMREDCLFEVPDEADGDFVSPAFKFAPTGDGGLRAYVKVGSAIEWWKSEFMLFDGKIVYRAAGDDQDRIMDVAPGQKLYLNFTTETGKIE